MKAILTLAALLTCIASCAALADPIIVWVELPAAKLERVSALASTGRLPWLERVLAGVDAGPLRPEEVVSFQQALRRIAESGSRVVDAGMGLEGVGGEMILRLDPALRWAPAWMLDQSTASAELAAGWSGSASWRDLRRIAGLDGVLRWEEVEEFLCLAPRQNRSLISMNHAPSHPLWRIRRAYEADKVFANSGIYFGIASAADRVFIRLELIRDYEEDLLPWTEGLLALRSPTDPPGAAEERTFFARRLRSSDERVYARCDRILQSVQQEWGDRAWIVLDASGSPDPFAVVAGPVSGGTPAERLARLVESLGRPARGEG